MTSAISNSTRVTLRDGSQVSLDDFQKTMSSLQWAQAANRLALSALYGRCESSSFRRHDNAWKPPIEALKENHLLAKDGTVPDLVRQIFFMNGAKFREVDESKDEFEPPYFKLIQRNPFIVTLNSPT